MLYLRVTHTPGLENPDLLDGLQEFARRGCFGKNKVNFTIARTFTDIIVTFGEGAPGHQHKLRRQITKLLDLRRANHPAKYIQDYKSQGPALRIPVLTTSLNDKRLSFPFRQGDYYVQLYQRAGDTAKYTDTLGYTVTLPRHSLSPAPPKQWAPCEFCGGQGREKANCYKEKILRLTDERAARPWNSLRPQGRQGISNPPPLASPTTQSTNSSIDSDDRSRILGYTLNPERRETDPTDV